MNSPAVIIFQAIEETDAVAKAFFRRGEAHLALNDCESAKLDFEQSLELEPDNKVCKRFLKLVFFTDLSLFRLPRIK